MPSIVQVQIQQSQAPTPQTLQQTGAFISQGATNLAPGTSGILTQLSDLTGLIKGALNLSAVSWSGGIVTATAAAPHGFTLSDTIYLTIAGALPSGYNGTYLCTITSTTQFTYILAQNPGTMTSAGTYTPESVAELNAMALTFFAQGSSSSVYILELGPGSPSEGVAALQSYITANPNSAYTPGASGFYYSYVVPRTWDANTNFLSFLANYESTTAKTYFFVTTTLSTYQNYTTAMKDVIALIEAPATAAYPANALTAISWAGSLVTATTTSNHGVSAGQWFQIQGVVPTAYNGWWLALPGTAGQTLVYALSVNPGVETSLGTLAASQVAFSGIPATEFSLAGPFFVALNYKPSPTNRVTPYAFSELFGVTSFPTQGNSALLQTLKNASINYVGTGAEGGITTAALFWGTTMDARDFTYWYSVDWDAINSQIAIANTIINGSNTPQNPLYYSQTGIDRLQDAVIAVQKTALAVGLANGQVTRSALAAPDFQAALTADQFDGQIVVNAVPFQAYLTATPGDYKTGTYNGLSVVLIPNRGFIHITFNLTVTDFAIA